MPLSELIHLSLTLFIFGVLEYWLTRAGNAPHSSRWTTIVFVGLPTAFLLWKGGPPSGNQLSVYHFLIVPIMVVLCWKLTTRNYEYPRGKEFSRIRLLLFGLAGLAGISVAALPFFLMCLRRFGVWTHHLHLSLRLVALSMAFRLSSAVLESIAPFGVPSWSQNHAWVMYLLMAVHLSHYVVPGVAKLTLGTNLWSWIVGNQTHLLLPAAYAWGWARFVPEQYLWPVARVLARLAPACNAAVIFLECGCLIAPFSAESYALFCCAFVLFHLFIFVLSGICFWENIIVNALFAGYLLLWFDPPTDTFFGIKGVCIVAALILLFPLRKAVWKPNRLAWWETPLLNRIRLEVVGRSGARYGLYNNFMCPREREFGRIPLRFCVDEPILTGHLGQVECERLRALVLATDGDPQALRELKRTQGELLYDARAVERFSFEMKALFRSMQEGHPRNPLPRSLRALKAPGGHFYYWGEHPPFTWQEEALALRVFYIEEYLFPNRRATISERLVLDIDLSSS
jgi:hypothetical protein